MDTNAARASYRRMLKDSVTVRRYTGTSRTVYVEAVAAADTKGYAPQDLVGSIAQGDTQAIVSVEDLTNNGFPLPVTRNDKLIIAGKEHNIIGCDDKTRSVNGVLIAYVLQVRG